jgi:hypothetical protein
VSEVGLFFLTDLDRYNMVMEGNLQQILERLLAGQEKMKADINAQASAHQEFKTNINAEAQACQDKADAKIEAAINSIWSDLERSLHQQMEALLEGWRSSEKGMTIGLVSLEVRPDNSKASPEEMEADMGTFEEC